MKIKALIVESILEMTENPAKGCQVSGHSPSSHARIGPQDRKLDGQLNWLPCMILVFLLGLPAVLGAQARQGSWPNQNGLGAGQSSEVVAGDDPDDDRDHQRSTAEDFLRIGVRPIAIGHHGVGPNRGEKPALPIENTVDSVRLAYRQGARVVEVDVQLTKDGRLAVFHDDFLNDFTCIHALTLDQLQQRLQYVPKLDQVLRVARRFNKTAGDDIGGIFIIELKAFSPHCDPGDELEQALVSAAVHEVRKMKMAKQVIFDSFSPALLYLAAQAAPNIPRELDLSGLQLLTPSQIQAITGLPVTIINKKNSLGLTWAEIGSVFRLPGYASPQQFLATGISTHVRVVGGELDFFGPAEQQQPGSAEAFVKAAQSLGLRVFADPASTEGDWKFFEALGVDAIYSDIPLGVRLQPVIPDLSLSDRRRERDGLDRGTVQPEENDAASQ